MKRFFLVYTFLFIVITFCHALTGESITRYQLKEYNTVEEFQEAYLNKVITYVPVKKYDYLVGAHPLSKQMGLDLTIMNFLVTSITGKTKKGKDTQDMLWTIKEVDGNTTVSFKVHTGNYKKKISEYSVSEYMFKDLQFYMLDAWKEGHKYEIGKQFDNPMVKAKYEVIDVFLAIEKDPEDFEEKLFKMYTLKNTIYGNESTYIAAEAQSLCFKDDLSGSYVSTLAKVEKPSNPSVKFGKTTIVEDKDITKYSYEDNFISIIIFGTPTQFCFSLKNVSESTQKLIWDEAVFVSYTGSTSKVMHSGIKYSQREEPQPASTIIRGASLDDIACPTSNVYYSDFLKEWTTKSMYPSEFSEGTKQVQLMLPIQIKDVTNEYIFVFDIWYKYKNPERLTITQN